MPLWALPQPKLLDGVEVPPWRTIGGRLFDPAREDDIAWLRAQYDEAQAKMPPPPKVGLLSRFLMWLGMDLVVEDPTTASFRERWDRPFEEVVANVAAERRLVEKYDPAQLEGHPMLAQLRSFPEFPAFLLDPDESGNVVAAEMDLQQHQLANPLEPPEMLELAEHFRHCASRYRDTKGDEENHVAICLHAVEAAAEWLSFWAERGHGSKGFWFIQTARGRIQVETG